MAFYNVLCSCESENYCATHPENSHLYLCFPIHIIDNHKSVRRCRGEGGIQSVLSRKNIFREMSRVPSEFSWINFWGRVSYILCPLIGWLQAVKDICCKTIVDTSERTNGPLAYDFEVGQRWSGSYEGRSLASHRTSSPLKNIYRLEMN